MTYPIHPDVKILAAAAVQQQTIEAVTEGAALRRSAENIVPADVSLVERSSSVDSKESHIDPRSLDALSALVGKSPQEIKAIMDAKGILSRGEFDDINFFRKAVALCDGGKMYAVYDYKGGEIAFYKTETREFVSKISLRSIPDGFLIKDLMDFSHEYNHPLKENYLVIEAKREEKKMFANGKYRIDVQEEAFFIYNVKNRMMIDLRSPSISAEINESVNLHHGSLTNCDIVFSFPEYFNRSSQGVRNTFVFTVFFSLSNKFSGAFLEQKTFVCLYNLETQTSEVLYTFPFAIMKLVLNEDNQVAAYLKCTQEEGDFDQEAAMLEVFEMRESQPEVIWRGLENIDLHDFLYDPKDPDSPYLVEADMNGDKSEPVLCSLRSNQGVPLLAESERQKLKSEIKDCDLNPRDLKDLLSYETAYDEQTLHMKLPNGSYEAVKSSMIQQSPLFQDLNFLTYLVQKLDIKEPYMFDFSTKMIHQFFLLSPESETSSVKFECIYSKHVLDDLKPEVRAKCSVPQSFTFKARDGLDIQGYMTLPVKKEAKNLPALLFVHGGPHFIRDKLMIHNEVQAWASRGFAVVQINFRGSGGFGKKFEEASKGEWHHKMTDDLIDGLNHWIQAGVVNPEKIVAYGASYGGFAAASCLTRYPDFFTCGIAVNGNYDLIEVVGGFESEKERIQHSKSYGVLIAEDNSVSDEDLEKLRQSSPYYALKNLKKPLFIISGAADDTCDPAQSHALAEKAQELGKSVLHVEFDDAGHSYDSVKSNAYQLYKLEFGLCENFVSRYLPEIFAEPVSADFAKEKTAHIIRSTL